MAHIRNLKPGWCKLFSLCHRCLFSVISAFSLSPGTMTFRKSWFSTASSLLLLSAMSLSLWPLPYFVVLVPPLIFSNFSNTCRLHLILFLSVCPRRVKASKISAIFFCLLTTLTHQLSTDNKYFFTNASKSS